MIAANLPDLDVLVFATDVPSVAFRRGWTHGILAQAVLPALLAAAMLAIGRWYTKPPAGSTATVALGPLLVLSYVGVLSHVLLDYLNNYGVRLLMPFSGRWFYGDTLFIVDPWLWLMFGVATALGGRGRIVRTRIGLAVACLYIVAMFGSARAARTIVLETWQRAYGTPPKAIMVGPVPVNPFRKAIIADAGDHYRRGDFAWFPANTVFADATVRKNDDRPAVRAARSHRRVAGILVWARFPFWELTPEADGTRVTVRDMRFPALGRGGFSATTTIRKEEGRRKREGETGHVAQ
jgi:inner membrane protein